MCFVSLMSGLFPLFTLLSCNILSFGKVIKSYEKFCILINISLKFVPKAPIDNNPHWFR